MSAHQFIPHSSTISYPEPEFDTPRRLEPTLHFPRPVRIFMRDERGIKRIVLAEDTAVVIALVRGGWTFSQGGGK